MGPHLARRARPRRARPCATTTEGTTTEAITVLTPPFLADYDTFAEWMARLLKRYAEQCRDLQREPDTQAFEPVLEEFRARGPVTEVEPES